MFYRIVTDKDTSRFGLILGRHTASNAANKALERDRKDICYSEVLLLETEEVLTVEECYPDHADRLLAERRQQAGERLMVEVLKARQGEGNGADRGNPKRADRAAGRIYLYVSSRFRYPSREAVFCRPSALQPPGTAVRVR